jgi:outer membrane protein TolC
MRRAVTLACLLAAGGSARAGEAITLEQAVHLALTRNERAAITNLDVEIAEASVVKARVAFLPVLQATGGATYSPWDKAPHTVGTGQLQVNQPIIAPSAWPLYDQAQHSLDAQRAQTVDDKRQLEFDTAHAYFNVLLAQRVLEAANHKLDTAKQNLADTDAQVKAQLVSSNDVTRATTDLSSSQREVAADTGNLEAAYVQLELLVNARLARSLVVPQAVIDAGGRPVGAIDGLVATSIKARPDLAAKHYSALAAHDFAREPHMRWFPTLSFSATTNASTAGTPSGHDVDGRLALNASWTIYDAGSREADERSREASATIADLNAEALVRTIDAQVRSAAAQLTASQQALTASVTAMDAARKSADETAILYKQGLAKAIELVDANEQRFLAEVSYAEAQFSLATAYLSLLQAMGRGPLEAP